jgi:hypothetical protein
MHPDALFDVSTSSKPLMHSHSRQAFSCSLLSTFDRAPTHPSAVLTASLSGLVCVGAGGVEPGEVRKNNPQIMMLQCLKDRGEAEELPPCAPLTPPVTRNVSGRRYIYNYLSASSHSFTMVR